MKQKELKETNPEIKNSPAAKSGRGGARKGAGRAGYVGPMKAFNCDLPEAMLDEMKKKGNKTEYLAGLILADLKASGTKKAVLNKIEKALEKVKK